MAVWSVEDLVQGIEASILEDKVKAVAIRDVRAIECWQFVEGLGEETVAKFTGGVLREVFDQYQVAEEVRLGVEASICQALNGSTYASVQK